MSVAIRKSEVLQALNMTPLIDVVFQLLIFFLVASQFAEADRQLDVELPSASQAQPLLQKPDDIELTIDASGNVYQAQGEPMSVEALQAMLAEAAANNPLHQTVVIRADRACPWNSVAQTLSMCYSAGLRDVKSSVAGSP